MRCTGRDEGTRQELDILQAMNLEHPIVFNHYNMCEMARQKELKNLKLGLLQTLCNKSDLEGSIVDLRQKASYVDALTNLVNGCSCSH